MLYTHTKGNNTEISSGVVSVLSRASAHGRLQLMQEKPGMGTYTEEPFQQMRPTIVAVFPGNFPTAVL